MPDLLIEVFSEEIPARMQQNASEALRKNFCDGIVEAGLTYGAAHCLSTPRRLVLAIEGVSANSPDLKEERKGPRVDAPEKAIEGFCRGAGVAREDLIVKADKKGDIFMAMIETKGRPAQEIIAQVLETVIRNFPWPKSMRWGAGSLRWVRPLHSIICLMNDGDEAQVVPVDIDGIIASNKTLGHRFMAPEQITVSSFDDYQQKLRASYVMLDAKTRADHIWADAQNLAFAAGLEVMPDPGLLAEVAGLVEWPVVLMGKIDDEFLGLPPEVLQTSMKEHQKFFSLHNPKTGQIERFITVANRETVDNGATILAGNQKVLSARLSDAKFFWENDLRIAKGDGLSAWTARLSNVTFHNKLGTQEARITRIAQLAKHLAPMVGADADEAYLAAHVAKADLSSEMVFEFPELQGIMGSYYAKAAGLSDAVAQACQAHYSPLGPSDNVPNAAVSIAVALADKLDSLAGFWAIDEKPTGSKDPFALRRAALGIIRLILENELDLQLVPLINAALAPVIAAGADADKLGSDLLGFIHDRLKVYLRDQGLRHDVIDANLASGGADNLKSLVARAKALGAIMATEDGENLIQGFKRAHNILSQAEAKDGVEYSYGADPKLAVDASETDLFSALTAADAKIAEALKVENYVDAMAAMAALRAPIDAFFAAVQVNDDNAIIRRNRLNLLSQIRTTCLKLADLARLEG